MEHFDDMSTFGNILWFIFGGFITALWYWLGGLLLCITIIGIPFGVQLFKFGTFALMPFGHEMVPDGQMGCLSIGFNVLWILFGWWEIALFHIFCGLLWCITIVGIPFGLQHFKLAIYSAMPFGKAIS